MQAQNTNKQHEESLSFLDKTGLKITRLVGTMGCAIAFTALAVFSLPAAIHTHDVVIIVAWVAQTFLQLVLLPIIIVGQNLQSRHDQIRAEEDFRVNQKAEQEIKDLHRKIDLLLKKGK